MMQMANSGDVIDARVIMSKPRSKQSCLDELRVRPA